MKNRDYNLTNSFMEYLRFASSNSYLNHNTIIISLYGALNDIDQDENIVNLMEKMISDYARIGEVITAEAKEIFKNEKYELISNRKDENNNELYTPQEISANYHISEQAIRKACQEGRLPFEEGKGKIKYLIKKDDIEKYMQTAKGKNAK